jgi:hypothetical protein
VAPACSAIGWMTARHSQHCAPNPGMCTASLRSRGSHAAHHGPYVGNVVPDALDPLPSEMVLVLGISRAVSIRVHLMCAATSPGGRSLRRPGANCRERIVTVGARACSPPLLGGRRYEVLHWTVQLCDLAVSLTLVSAARISSSNPSVVATHSCLAASIRAAVSTRSSGGSMVRVRLGLCRKCATIICPYRFPCASEEKGSPPAVSRSACPSALSPLVVCHGNHLSRSLCTGGCDLVGAYRCHAAWAANGADCVEHHLYRSTPDVDHQYGGVSIPVSSSGGL